MPTAIRLTALYFSITTKFPTRRRARSLFWDLPGESRSGGTPPVQVIMLNNKPPRQPLRKKLHSESGVTILEMVVAMLVLTVGLLGLAASIGYAVTVSNKGRNITNSKLMGVSLLEQMETLRNSEELTFAQIRNQGQTVDDTGAARSFGGFPPAFQPLSINPGPDGIYGTDDDDSASVVP